MDRRNLLLRRTAMMVIGIAAISLSVGLYRLSGFGVDAFTCMNLGIRRFLDLQVGTGPRLMLALTLVVVVFL